MYNIYYKLDDFLYNSNGIIEAEYNLIFLLKYTFYNIYNCYNNENNIL